MGHIHLGVLPASKKWRDVVELLQDGALASDVIQSSAIAAERDLRDASKDPLFVECVRLLGMIPLAARNDEFGRALRDLGLPARDDPDLMDVVSAAGEWLDRRTRELERSSDFGELSRRALLSTLSLEIGDRLPGLFDATAENVRLQTREFSGSAQFSVLARTFFTRLLSDTLRNWLDRTLSAQIGAGKRFHDIGERSAFDAALGQYCQESTRIIREFAGGWYGKTVHREGEIDTLHAAIFGSVCFKKITEELRFKRAPDV